MKKSIICILSLLLLTGCSSEIVKTISEAKKTLLFFTVEYSKEDIKNMMDEAISTVSNISSSKSQNNNKPYYSYYLPPHIGKRYADQTGSIFVSNNQEFVMNLNVANVIVNRYYTKNSIQTQNSITDDSIYSYSGEVLNYKDTKMKFNIQVYQIEENAYFLNLKTDYFTFYCYTNSGYLASVVKDMLTIARTTNVYQSKVLAAYSNKEIVNYKSTTTEMFKQKAPENGMLKDMLEGAEVEFDWNFDDIDTDLSQNEPKDEVIEE